MATMRAVDIKNGAGPISSLFINDKVPKPTAQPGEAVVKVKCFGLNRMDVMQREGHYPVPPQASKILGVEFSGVVESLAEDNAFKIGDEVFGLAYGGAYAEYLAVSTKMLLHKPHHLSWEQAASVPETWITATQAMYFVGDFNSGKSILWHAGASGVSIAGIQLSKAGGASQILVTAGSQEKIDFCVNELGASAGFNYRTQDWSKEVTAASSKNSGVDVIVDFIGADYFQGNINAAARDGHIICLGLLGGRQTPAGVDVSGILLKRLCVQGSTLRSRDIEYQGKLRDKLEEYLPKFEDGTFKIFIEKVFPWEDIIEATQTMEANTSKGKIVCRIP